MPQFNEKVEILNSSGKVIFSFDPNSSFVQFTHMTPGGQLVTELTNTGSLSLVGAGNNWGARLDGTLGWLFLGGSGKVGRAALKDAAGNDLIVLDAANSVVTIGASGNEGDLIIRDGAGREVFNFDGSSAFLHIGASGNEGDLRISDSQGRDVFDFDGSNAVLRVGADGNEGDVIVRNGSGVEVIHLDGGSGDIILANADCAEDFDVAGAAGIEPGSVMVLGDDGMLLESTEAYDKRVAGVISGAGDYKPGIVLDRKRSERARMPLALMGKAYCKVDSALAPVAVGDLLTTSSTPGHAMKATDPLRAFGAVIGKALRPLHEGRGLIPVLIALG